MSRIIFILTLVAYTHSLHGQLEIDYYGKDFDYQGNLISVTSKYYQAIYEEDSLMGYQIDTNGILPYLSKAHYNEANQLVLFEEFDGVCGLEKECLKSSTKYVYQENKIAQRIKSTKWDPKPIPITYTYLNQGDSVFYEYQKRINYIQYKSIRKPQFLLREWNKKNTEKTYFDSLGYPIREEQFFKETLKRVTTYQRFEENNEVVYHITNKHINRNSITRFWASFNQAGYLTGHGLIKNDAPVGGNYFSYQFDQYNNCKEIKISNKNGKEIYKVVKIYSYR